MPSPVRCLRALLLSLTLLLPSCVTSALWEFDEKEALHCVATSETELAADWCLTTGRDCALDVAARGAAGRGGCSEWSLTPGDGGHITLALLQDPELLPNPTLRVTAQRDWERGELKHAVAEVELTGELVLSQIGRPIDVATLTDAARAAHEAARGRPRFAFAAAVSISSIDLLERCEQRVAALTLHHLSPPPAIAMNMMGATFVDAAGAPFQAPPNPKDRPRTIAEELALLRDVRAIVTATDGRAQHTFELRMDRAWLWAALSRQPDGQVRYASDWTFRERDRRGSVDAESAASAAVPPPSPATAQLRLVDHIYDWSTEGMETDEFLGRLALTPLALACDVLFGWIGAMLDFDDEFSEEECRREEEERERKRLRGRGKRR